MIVWRSLIQPASITITSAPDGAFIQMTNCALRYVTIMACRRLALCDNAMACRNFCWVLCLTVEDHVSARWGFCSTDEQCLALRDNVMACRRLALRDDATACRKSCRVLCLAVEVDSHTHIHTAMRFFVDDQ
ncbi:hypothetical protein PGT21_017719 [Puccinia graminis f. sp. tritici]|uniref:Uncharacterized protein n=1 Tax=Puccinia graminis f. sp. tritici TaxID=56615 RepID=A0A5B0NE93_PUCGR|nr:hypothetical protein PGT21_017719 [Puccinia graminis f. sp. tritici]